MLHSWSIVSVRRPRHATMGRYVCYPCIYAFGPDMLTTMTHMPIVQECGDVFVQSVLGISAEAVV